MTGPSPYHRNLGASSFTALFTRTLWSRFTSSPAGLHHSIDWFTAASKIPAVFNSILNGMTRPSLLVTGDFEQGFALQATSNIRLSAVLNPAVGENIRRACWDGRAIFPREGINTGKVALGLASPIIASNEEKPPHFEANKQTRSKPSKF